VVVGVRKLPRELEESGEAAAVRSALVRRKRLLWINGDMTVSVVRYSHELKAALGRARDRGQVERGLEGAERALENASKGRRQVEERSGVQQGRRVSRVLLLASDGSERFYRRAERVLLPNQPQVLGCVVEACGSALGELLFGPGEKAKAVLVAHKDAVTDVLRAVAGHAEVRGR
jgi:hypothetical protein